MVGSPLQLRKSLIVIMAVFIAITTVMPAHAAILFQDDTFATTESDAVQIGSNDTGASNTSIKFGADSTASENGNITWNVSSNTFSVDHTTSITGGISATGNANFSGASEFHIRQVADEAAATCTTVKELVLDTTENKIYVCTATGSPGTWTVSAIDFEGVYSADAGKNLVTTNGAFTIDTGTNSFVVDSNSWNVTAAGSFDAATVTSNGLLTGSAGANISGGIINFNASSNFATNINTGTSTGTVTIGGTGTQTLDIGNGAGVKTVNVGSSNTTSTTTLLSGSGGLKLNVSNNQVTNIGTGTTTGQVSIGGNSDCVQVDSNTWDVSCAGVLSGLTGLSSGGVVNFSTSTSYRIAEASSDPGTCTAGQQYFNTTTSTVRLCTATNTWSSSGASGTQYVFAYDTTTQTVATAGTFQDVTFSTNAQLNGWTHTASTASFTAGTAGTYLVNVTARSAKNGGANTTHSLRAVINGTEVAGSQSYGQAAASTGSTTSGLFMIVVVASDVFKVQMTGGTNNVQVLPGGSGTTKPSIQLTIWRLT